MMSAVQLSCWALGGILFGCILYYYAEIVHRAGKSSAWVDEKHVSCPSNVTHKPRSAFNATRLTPSTFLIIEHDDIYHERPYIYAKVIPSAGTLLLFDTGCGGVSNDPEVEVTKLRDFLESVGVEDNEGRPLNEGARMRYMVVLSHCHYDHILGVEQFAKDSPIFASSHSPSFLSAANLPTHSLCKVLKIRTPSYTPTLVTHLHFLPSLGSSLKVLHTPGHTPDELALWDEQDRMLYVGDTLYEREPIIFPKEGSIVIWLQTIDYLISFVRQSQASSSNSKIRISCGHATASAPALELLGATKGFMMDVVCGNEIVLDRWEERREETVMYQQDGGRFTLVCPERLVLEVREVVRL